MGNMAAKITDSGAGSAPETPPRGAVASWATLGGIAPPERAGEPGTPADGSPAVAASPAKRKPGRKPGSPKASGSGRRKGTPNKNRAATIERITKEGDPIGRLINISLGKRMPVLDPNNKRGKKTWMIPSPEMQFAASKALADKIAPNMKAVELTGADGAPVFETMPELLARLAAQRGAGNG